jgi:rhamnulose-1-phosphate aldolase/alcohol dehydrogenase
MTSAVVLDAIAAPVNRWDAGTGTAEDAVDELVHRSNLLGADPAIANQGGGNTSVKEQASDHAGRSVRLLWVKGSGTDLRTISRAGFAGLRLDELLVLQAAEALDDASMVAYLSRCAVRPDQPRPSIETLLHAFIPATHVDHTHPDAIIALTAAPAGRELAEKTFGSEAVWLPYERPGFAMSKRIAELLNEAPTARAVLLEKHGLVTWGETSEESYRNTLEFVRRAAEAVAEAGAGRCGLGGEKFGPLDDSAADEILVSALPELRGALLADSDGVILEVDRSPEAVAFVSSELAAEVSQVGAPCPDHLIVTKHKPAVVAFDPEQDDAAALAAAFRDEVSSYADWYRSYYDTNLSDETAQFPIDPAGPRVVLTPAIGVIAAGSDAGKARHARDLYHRAIVVENAANASGGYRSLTDNEAFNVEYWPLERYKLAQAPPRGELAGRIAVVTGGASGIGRAAAYAVAQRGAHVVVADRNVEGAEIVAADLSETFGLRRAVAIGVDVTDEAAVADVFRATVLAYGGLDILVASAGLATSASVIETSAADWQLNFDVLARGYFLVAREAFKVLLRQGVGGSIVFVGSKNALVGGANASAYSSAKAAALHLARCLAEEGGPNGIRVNTVNPDAVIQGSSIWSSEWKAERASTYGVEEGDLQAFYTSRTKLGVAVLPEDVAEAIAFFAGPRSLKSTGNILNVDGGVTAAYPR